jgi:hypothetical protein
MGRAALSGASAWWSAACRFPRDDDQLTWIVSDHRRAPSPSCRKDFNWNENPITSNIVFWFQVAYAIGIRRRRIGSWTASSVCARGDSLAVFFWSLAAIGARAGVVRASRRRNKGAETCG